MNHYLIAQLAYAAANVTASQCWLLAGIAQQNFERDFAQAKALFPGKHQAAQRLQYYSPALRALEAARARTDQAIMAEAQEVAATNAAYSELVGGKKA